MPKSRGPTFLYRANSIKIKEIARRLYPSISCDIRKVTPTWNTKPNEAGGFDLLDFRKLCLEPTGE
jgi:hypothetical protein